MLEREGECLGRPRKGREGTRVGWRVAVKRGVLL